MGGFDVGRGKTTGRMHNEVTTNDEGVVVVLWRGRQTADAVRQTGQEMRTHLEALRSQHKKTLLLADISTLTAADSTSEARLAAKELLTLPIDASAVVGKGIVLGLALYMMRVAKPGINLRYFSNSRNAFRWLHGTAKPALPRSALGLVAAITVAAIGLLTLIGWQISNDHLISLVTRLRPMNPVAAVGMICMGFGFFMYWLGKLRYLWWTGVLGVVLGMAALLPLDIDTLLYGAKVAARHNAYIADSAAMCFFLMGIAAFLTGRPHAWIHRVQYGLAGLVIALSLFNVFGQLYAIDVISRFGQDFVMSFNVALAFLVGGSSLFLLIVYKEKGDVFGFVSRTGWLIVAALLFMQIATYAAWSQSITRNKTEARQNFEHRIEDLRVALTDRIDSYMEGLYGFRGLFMASDTVTQADFNMYYKSLDIPNRHPGLRSVSFIARVPEGGLTAFVVARQKDTSLFPGGNPSFAIQSKTSQPVHYIATYSGQDPGSSRLGLDVGSIAGRTEVYDAALSSPSGYVSGTIRFLATSTQPAQNGFLLSLPVASAKSSEHIGLVNASANYADFFSKVIAENHLLNDVGVDITHDTTHDTLFESRNATGDSLSKTVTMPILNQRWNMMVAAPETFGLGASQLRLPKSVLFTGQALSILLVIIFVIQGRARRQALDLAESMTEDLQIERNRAIASDEKSQAILSSIGDAVFAIDKQENITLFNPAAEIISGYTRTEAVGKPYKEVLKFISRETGKVREAFVHRALHDHISSMRDHTQLVRKNGTMLSVADSAAPIHDSSGDMLGAIIVFRDVSKEEALDQAKSEFVSLASHQLRTPLSAVNWYVEALMHGDLGKLNQGQLDYLREVYEGNQRMVELVSSLLDVSRLDLGRMTNKPQLVDLSDLVANVQKELAGTVSTKGQHVANHITARLPQVSADPKLLRMIVQNLLSNAVKYTPNKGSVEVTLRRASHDDLQAAGTKHGGPHLFFSVKDSGYGIPKEQQGKIFQKLFRADNVRKMDMEGTGLGLYIVKQVVEKLGGKVWFTSMESAGTTFSVVLPFKTIQSKLPADAPSADDAAGTNGGK